MITAVEENPQLGLQTVRLFPKAVMWVIFSTAAQTTGATSPSSNRLESITACTISST
jgi:hypothetical protein